MTLSKRPLSPHFHIYRPQLTSILSITHRATGIFLALGTLLLVYWLFAVAGGPETYERARAVIGSMLGQLLLFCFTWALFYHLCNGVRHLFWDAGFGFELEAVYKSGWAVVVGSVVMTLVCWLAAA